MDHDTQTAADQQHGPALTGIVANRFLIGERIGKGGMGEVYRAHDKKLNRVVAIKRISPRFRDNAVYRSRLLKEARHASVLNNLHIAAVYDVFTEGSESFLVMEFVDGQSLRHYIDGAIGEEDFLNIARQCLQGLAAAHQRRIVHCDIKPENILVTRDKEVKICDFGLARLTLQEGEDQPTVTIGIHGTPAYMAPEVHMGSASDPRSDIFSMGTLLFELWTGHRPFAEKSFRGMSSSSKVPPRPGAVRPGLNSRVDGVIQRMLSFSPADRYGNAIQALADLDLPHTSPVPARPRRKRWMFAPAVAGALVLAILMGNRFPDRAAIPDAGPPSVLLADIENRTDDQYFDFTVSQLVALAMDQSQYLNVMSHYRVAEAKANAKVPAGAPVTAAIALDLARRESARFVLAGGVERKEGQFLLTLRANDSDSGKEEKVFTSSFNDASGLALSVQNATREVRAWLGEPLTKINETNVSLGDATTQSAVAWERFSRGVQTDSLGASHLPDAVALLKSAIEVDPNFAMAHEKLAAMQSRLGNLTDSLESIRRAYDLRNLVTEREKYTIVGQYHVIRWEFDLAMDAFHKLIVLYPYDDLGRRYYAQALSAVLQKTEAIDEARNAMALNPGSTINRGTLMITLALANRNDEVISMMDDLRSRGIQTPETSEGNAWLGKGDFARARAVFQKIASQSESQGNYGRLQLAKTLIYEGKLEEGAAILEADLRNDLPLRDERLAVQRRDWLAWIRALQGNGTAAANLATVVLQSPLGPTNVYQLREVGCMLSETGDLAQAVQALQRLEDLVKSGFSGRFFNGAVLHMKGEIARAQGDRQLARRYLDQAATQWVDVLTLWSLARVSEELGDFQAARTSYREILGRQGETIRVHFPGLTGLALAGALRSELALGNLQQVRKDFQQFSNTLGGNSPDLKIVQDLRQQLSTIQN